MSRFSGMLRGYAGGGLVVVVAFYVVFGTSLLLGRLAVSGGDASPFRVAEVLFTFFFIAGGPISPGMFLGAFPPVLAWWRMAGEARPGAVTPVTIVWSIVGLSAAMTAWGILFFAVLIRPNPSAPLRAGALLGTVAVSAGAGWLLRQFHRRASSTLAAWIWAAPGVWVWVGHTASMGRAAEDLIRLAWLVALSLAAYVGAWAGALSVREAGRARATANGG